MVAISRLPRRKITVNRPASKRISLRVRIRKKEAEAFFHKLDAKQSPYLLPGYHLKEAARANVAAGRMKRALKKLENK